MTKNAAVVPKLGHMIKANIGLRHEARPTRNPLLFSDIPHQRYCLKRTILSSCQIDLLVMRTDDTIDYGYLAVVRGDPQAKVDTPDLMLYVIRDAKNAVAKGKKPIDKDEVLKMAEAIAASVKHRPVQ